MSCTMVSLSTIIQGLTTVLSFAMYPIVILDGFLQRIVNRFWQIWNGIKQKILDAVWNRILNKFGRKILNRIWPKNPDTVEDALGLIYLMMNDEAVCLWDKIASRISYQFPINPHVIRPTSLKKNSKEEELLIYALEFASYIYFMPIVGAPNGITIKPENKCVALFGPPCEPGYFIGVDDEHKRIVLCIRGTETIGDVICDFDGRPEPKSFGSQTYNVHPGIFKATEYLHKDQKVTDTIKNLLVENEGYKVIVTGHSLAAGVAALLGLIWKSEKIFDDDEFMCYSFACPLVIDEDGVRKSMTGNNMISVAVSTDIVTRLSVKAAHQMKARLEQIKRTPNYKEICENIANSKWGIREKTLIRTLKRTHGVCYDYPDLFPTGRLIWSVPDCIVPETGTSRDELEKIVDGWTLRKSSVRMMHFAKNVMLDFTHLKRNETLTELSSDIPKDRFYFKQMVFNGPESFQAHFPGRYGDRFGVDIMGVLKMSKYSAWIQIFESILRCIPCIIIDAFVGLVSLILFGIAITHAYGFIIAFMAILSNVYKQIKKSVYFIIGSGDSESKV